MTVTVPLVRARGCRDVSGLLAEDGLGGTLTRNAAERDRVRHGVAAQTVLAVHATRHFARCKESVDGLASGVNHAGLCVDLHASHVMMDGGRDLDGVEGRRVHQVLDARTVKVGVLPCLGVFVVLADRGDQRLRVDPGVDREFFKRGALLREAQFKGRGGLLHRVTHLLVEDFKGDAACLRRHGRARLVAGREFADEALPFDIHKDRTGSAHAFGYDDGRTDQERRIELNFLDIDVSRTDVPRENETVALTAGLVRREGRFGNVGTQFLEKRFVAADAAGGKDDRLGLEKVEAVVLALDDDTCDGTLPVPDDAHHLAVETQIDVRFTKCLLEKVCLFALLRA